MTARLDLEMVNVGHGDALILQWTPADGPQTTVVVDGGPNGGGQRLVDALNLKKTTTVDLLVLTHSDADHVDGLVEFANHPDRPSVTRFWSPCLPAFKRHEWLFPARMARGLKATGVLENALAAETTVSYPVEGADWMSSDGGLTIRVLSPAGQLIERLLLAEDSDDLFLQQPTPLGFLLGPAAPDPIEDAFSSVRRALRSGEIDRRQIPDLPPPRRLGSAGELAEASGIDPEFFGNNVLNDTSIVLLVEAWIGDTRRRILLTGDLENFTYLMAVHPMGLGCEVVKAPHHGSFSYVGRQRAFDEVWQWLRPKAVLVSANGKHKLPRAAFRDAALRHGATLFCTCRRTRELVTGPRLETSCHEQFSCRTEASVRLTLRTGNLEADIAACGSGAHTAVTPVIQFTQHTVDPSNVLDRFTEGELRKYVRWAIVRLADVHAVRRAAARDIDIAPYPLSFLAADARADRLFGAAANIETIIDRAARDGAIWRSSEGTPSAYINPGKEEWVELRSWIDGFETILLNTKRNGTALVAHELLLASDTAYLAERAASNYAFPKEMFADALWPLLSRHLRRIKKIGVRVLHGGVMVVCSKPAGSEAESIERAAAAMDRGAAGKVVRWAGGGSRYERQEAPLIWPQELRDVFAPPSFGGRIEMPPRFRDAMRGDEDWRNSGDAKLDLAAKLPAKARSIVEGRNFIWKSATASDEICSAILAAWPHLDLEWL